MKGRSLRVPIGTIFFAPRANPGLWHDAENDEYRVANDSSLNSALDSLDWPGGDDEVLRAVLWVLENIATIRKRRRRRQVTSQDSRGARPFRSRYRVCSRHREDQDRLLSEWRVGGESGGGRQRNCRPFNQPIRQKSPSRSSRKRVHFVREVATLSQPLVQSNGSGFDGPRLNGRWRLPATTPRLPDPPSLAAPETRTWPGTKRHSGCCVPTSHSPSSGPSSTTVTPTGFRCRCLFSSSPTTRSSWPPSPPTVLAASYGSR